MKKLIYSLIVLFFFSCSDEEVQYVDLSLSSNIEDCVITGSGTYEFNKTCTIKANSNNSNYSFAGWYEKGVFKYPLSEYSFNLSGDTFLEARFFTDDYINSIEGYVLYQGVRDARAVKYNISYPISLSAGVESTISYEEEVSFDALKIKTTNGSISKDGKNKTFRLSNTEKGSAIITFYTDNSKVDFSFLITIK
ncbi:MULTISPECIES: hypothetical protein [unclassified Dysgonomonas]|uniref:hypothetical protein n=1 Tax=unclassified Dysgonomonas TaxID=2630389 RepID=UPI002476D5CC|nr:MULTISPECIES: hypothetical protein [unclassified Dysgonomonas]